VANQVTHTVDEDMMESVQTRAAALERLLTRWDTAFGPVPANVTAAATAAFDDLDAVDSPTPPA